MITSLPRQALQEYTSRQLNYFFPDNNIVDLNNSTAAFSNALDRIEHCFSYCTLKQYNNGTNTLLNHLYSDHYMLYIWFLANTIWKENGDPSLCNKLYYLNKALHGLDCMYDTKLPAIFLIFHGAGTMLGKAAYDDFLIVQEAIS